MGTITAQAALLAAPTSTGTGTSVPPTDTTSPLTVSVTANTNCRLGPTTDYEVDFTLHPGETALVVGKNTDVDYWIIDDPGGATCWLWGQYAVLNGNAGSLPELVQDGLLPVRRVDGCPVDVLQLADLDDNLRPPVQYRDQLLIDGVNLFAQVFEVHSRTSEFVDY